MNTDGPYEMVFFEHFHIDFYMFYFRILFEKFLFFSANRELAEIDICLLKPYRNYIGVLLLCDCNSRYLYYSPIKSKKKEEVLAALKKILKESGPFQRVVSDGMC